MYLINPASKIYFRFITLDIPRAKAIIRSRSHVPLMGALKAGLLRFLLLGFSDLF